MRTDPDLPNLVIFIRKWRKSETVPARPLGRLTRNDSCGSNFICESMCIGPLRQKDFWAKEVYVHCGAWEVINAGAFSLVLICKGKHWLDSVCDIVSCHFSFTGKSDATQTVFYYQLRSKGDNRFGSIRLSVCLCVYALLFEPFNLCALYTICMAWSGWYMGSACRVLRKVTMTCGIQPKISVCLSVIRKRLWSIAVCSGQGILIIYSLPCFLKVDIARKIQSTAINKNLNHGGKLTVWKKTPLSYWHADTLQFLLPQLVMQKYNWQSHNISWQIKASGLWLLTQIW